MVQSTFDKLPFRFCRPMRSLLSPRRRFILNLATSGLGFTASAILRASAQAQSGDHGPVPINVLFFGNSHTYTHQVPSLFDHLCRSSGQFNPLIGSVTDGGVSLAQLLDDPRVIEAAAAKTKWDVLVLQEQSTVTASAPAFNETAKSFADAISGFTSLFRVRNPDLLVVLYQTWPYNPPTWPVNASAHALFGKSQEEMHQRMRLANARAAESLRAELRGTNVRVLVSPVGDFWMQVRRAHPNIQLYSDSNHASPAGAWLAAYVLLGTIGGRATIERAAWDGSLDKPITDSLRQVVLDNPEFFHQAGKVE